MRHCYLIAGPANLPADADEQPYFDLISAAGQAAKDYESGLTTSICNIAPPPTREARPASGPC